jgi:flagellar hook protein FlgE
MSLIDTLNTGVSALNAFSTGLDVVGNNIANVNTIGYKSASTSFEDSFSNTLQNSSPATGTTSSTAPIQVGTGVEVAGTATNYTQGALTSTGVTTDLAVSGNGFFIVQDPATLNQFATRDGEFTVNSSGYLVTQNGQEVMGYTGGSSASPLGTTVGPIQIGQNPPTGTSLQSVSIDSSGNVVEAYSDGTTATTNRVLLQNFGNTSALLNNGNNLYTNLGAAAPIGGGILAGSNTAGSNGLGNIQSGSLESSNVDLTQEFSNLITMQRSFQAGARLITVSDTVLDDIVNLKRS